MLKSILKILKHLKVHFINMCTKLANSKVFYIVMILFTIIGAMADCFNQSDIAMLFTLFVVIGIGLVSTGICFNIQQTYNFLVRQRQEKINNFINSYIKQK